MTTVPRPVAAHHLGVSLPSINILVSLGLLHLEERSVSKKSLDALRERLDEMLSAKDICKLKGISNKSLKELYENNEFPKPDIWLNRNMMFWDLENIKAYL